MNRIRNMIAATCVAVMALLATSVVQAERYNSFDPLVAYGPEVRFSVWRKGNQIGTHVVQFRRDGDQLDVQIDFQVRVRILGITAYRFEYGSSATWDGSTLTSIDAAVNDDGTEGGVNARRYGEEIVVDGTRGLRRVEGVLFPSNHWHPGVIGQTRVLNTLTGGVGGVSMDLVGQEMVDTAHGEVRADRYLFSGDLHDVDVWYDSDGRWVKLRFLTKGGEQIEYRCEQCRAANGIAENLQ
ncbi:MAG: DUF6134 family protein [Minwuia sp.]|nr:DUF6134 family protein [Minwuia sp.]